MSPRTLFLGLALLAAAGIFAPLQAQFGNGYTYRREIDVVDAQVSGSHTNFPFLFAGTLLDLRTTVNGGKVENNPNGHDIIFTSDLAGTTQLAHEIEAYNPATGDFTIWVRVESLVATTKIYLFYGNSSISTFQGNVTSNGVTGVWDNDFLTVLHLHDDFLDATSNGNDVVNTGSTDIAGKIGDGQDFDGLGDRLADEDAELFINGLTAVTVELWIRSDVTGTDRGFIETEEPDGSDDILGLRYDNAGSVAGGNNVIKAGIDVGSGANASESSINIQTTNWQHVVYSWSSGSAPSLYLDGGLDTPTAAPAAQSGAITGATKLVIGEGPKDDGASDGWDGRIDEVRISGVARAAGWIQTEYNNQDSPSSFYAIGVEETNGSDSTAPDAVTNLATGTVTSSSVALSWTAPGDDGPTGTATTYDIRYSTTAITEDNWASATEATGEPSPQGAGSGESFTVTGLSIATNYYFAIKTSDEVPNESAISNVPNVSTANSGIHWGRDVQNATAYGTGQSRAMGGTSPDIDYMVIDTVAIYLGAQVGDVRLAVYTGGTEEFPTGATLLYDFGAVTGTGTAGWFKAGHPSGIAWPKNTVTWVAFKGDQGVSVYYSETLAAAGDFQTVRGRNANSFSTDPAVGFPGAYASTGFSPFWYSIYVVHSVEPPNAVTSAVAEISPNSVAANSTANAFTYAIKATIGGTDTGVDSLTISVPSTFGDPTVTDVQVGGTTVGYTDNTAGKLISINLTVPVTVTDSIEVLFTADAPTAIDATGKDFASTVDDTGTSTPAQSSTEGSADSDAGDNNSWTVTTTSATCSVGWKCWDGEGSTNDWSEDANWTGNTAPASTDSVAFNATSTKDATLDVASTVAALTIDSGYGAGTLTLAAALTNDGNFIQNGGTLDLSGQTFTQRGNWTYTAGTTPTDGTVLFDDSNTATLTVTGSHSLANVTVNSSATFNFTIAAGDTLTVNGTYTHQGTNRIDIEGGDVHAKGDVALSNTATGGSGSGTLTINGTGTQNLTGGAALRQGRVNNIVIDKATGTLNLFQNINVRSTWTYIQGTIAAGTSTLVFTVNPTITGSHSVANVNFNARGSDRTVTIAGGTTLTATGTVTYGGNNTNSLTLDGGDLHAQGDIVLSAPGLAGGGTATITMNGTGAQALTGPASAGLSKLPNLTVDKSTGTVTLTGHPTVAGTLTLTQGELAHGTGAINSLTVEGASAVSVAVAGTWTNYSTFTSTVTLGGTVVNAGTIDFNSTATTCGDADVILIRSSASPTQRLWSGAGTFGMIDVNVQDQAGSAAIDVQDGTDATGNGGNWTFSPCTAYAVTVTPDTTVVGRLPSNGTNYTVDFTVVNTGNVTDDFDFLTTQVAGTAITVVSITGTGVTQDADPDSARVSNLAATDTVIVTVTYSVADVAAGTADTLFFPARSVGDPGQTDDGRLELTVLRPNITTGKVVSPTGTQAPGTELTYTVTITNDGTDDATSVVVVDSIAVELEFKVGSVVNNLPSGVTATVEYSNDAGSSWTYVPVSLGCGAPANFDSCVTHIRWTLDNDLSYIGPDNTGNVEFVTRIQ